MLEYLSTGRRRHSVLLPETPPRVHVAPAGRLRVPLAVTDPVSLQNAPPAKGSPAADVQRGSAGWAAGDTASLWARWGSLTVAANGGSR